VKDNYLDKNQVFISPRGRSLKGGVGMESGTRQGGDEGGRERKFTNM